MLPKRCLEAGCTAHAHPGYPRCLPHQRLTYRPYNHPAYRSHPRAPRCERCGATTDLTRDHIMPTSKGGGADPANLRTLCRPCNSSKGDNT